jgi:hypothetical protein
MRSDPKPGDTALGYCSESPIPEPYPYRPEVTDSLEVKRGVPWIYLQELEVLVRRVADGLRKAPVMQPERRGRRVLQIGVHFPSAKSCLASRANRSSLPALISASICSSQSLACNSENQSASCTCCSRGSWTMAASISSTLMRFSISVSAVSRKITFEGRETRPFFLFRTAYKELDVP